MRIKLLFLPLVLLFSLLAPIKATAAVTWDIQSKKDVTYDGDVYNAQYDLEYVSAQIFDNDTDFIYFYMDFLQVPKVGMFNDGLESFAFIGLDYDMDGDRDIRLELDEVTLRTDRQVVDGTVWDPATKKVLDCDLGIYANIAEGDKWIGFKVSRKCIGLPLTFDLFAYAEFNNKGNVGSWDYAPYPYLRVNLPGAPSSSTTSTTQVPSSGATFTLPASTANASTESRNFNNPPTSLSTLSDSLLPSVVTVKCGLGSGTGWSADVALSQTLKDAGYQTLIVTNHHVIEDCLSNKNVSLVLSNGSTVAGQVISWNETSDVAGVATKTVIPAMQWIGSNPRQGWWVGVLGSPLGKSNVLTTGIISSVNTNTKKFTLTAAINPGNSGGPVFDNTGRVLGLATSKAVLSDGQLAEGFGNAHGVPLLCGNVIICQVESDPWNGKSKFTAGPTAEELAAQAAEAAAKAKAEAEAKAKAEAEAKLREDMRNKCIKFNGDVEVALFNAKNGLATFPASASAFNNLIQSVPNALPCDSINLTTFDAELQSKQKLLTTFEIALTSALANAQANANRRTTITCVKGKLIKKVVGVNPKCPKGYKKK